MFVILRSAATKDLAYRGEEQERVRSTRDSI